MKVITFDRKIHPIQTDRKITSHNGFVLSNISRHCTSYLSLVLDLMGETVSLITGYCGDIQSLVQYVWWTTFLSCLGFIFYMMSSSLPQTYTLKSIMWRPSQLWYGTKVMRVVFYNLTLQVIKMLCPSVYSKGRPWQAKWAKVCMQGFSGFLWEKETGFSVVKQCFLFKTRVFSC